MSTSGIPTKRYIWLSATVLLATIAYAIFKPASKEVKPRAAVTEEVFQPKKEVIPEPVSTQVLSDSTLIFLLHKEASFKAVNRYPNPREAAVDGEMYVEVKDSSRTLTLRSRLLVVEVMGKARFRVIAWAKEAGEEVQVLSGTLRVRPNYTSQFNTPDTLHGNQMVMINKDIDMMEKEKFDATTLNAWQEKLHRP